MFYVTFVNICKARETYEDGETNPNLFIWSGNLWIGCGWCIKNNFCGVWNRHGGSAVGSEEKDMDFQQWMVYELYHETGARLWGPPVCGVSVNRRIKIATIR